MVFGNMITSVRHQYGGKAEHVQSNWNSKGFDLILNWSEIHGYSWSDNRHDKNGIYSSLNMLRSPSWKTEAPSSRFSAPLAILLSTYFCILLKILREFICFTCFEMRVTREIGVKGPSIEHRRGWATVVSPSSTLLCNAGCMHSLDWPFAVLLEKSRTSELL